MPQILRMVKLRVSCLFDDWKKRPLPVRLSTLAHVDVQIAKSRANSPPLLVILILGCHDNDDGDGCIVELNFVPRKGTAIE